MSVDLRIAESGTRPDRLNPRRHPQPLNRQRPATSAATVLKPLRRTTAGFHCLSLRQSPDCRRNPRRERSSITSVPGSSFSSTRTAAQIQLLLLILPQRGLISEEHMLTLTCERARCRNGMAILELGCGWGSLTACDGRAATLKSKQQSPASLQFPASAGIHPGSAGRSGALAT